MENLNTGLQKCSEVSGAVIPTLTSYELKARPGAPEPFAKKVPCFNPGKIDGLSPHTESKGFFHPSSSSFFFFGGIEV
jgi:hypothetical protein